MIKTRHGGNVVRVVVTMVGVRERKRGKKRDRESKHGVDAWEELEKKQKGEGETKIVSWLQL